MLSSNKRIGRTNLEANQLTANLLVLNGHRFTSDDLLRRPAPAVLVQPQQSVVADQPPAVDLHGARLEQLEQALAQTREAIESARSIQLQRTAVKRNKHWYVAGHRVNAGDLQGDSQRYFAIASYSTVADALQGLAAELDALHANRPLSDSGSISS